MALFGRRKPGFSKEVTLKPEEIPGEFSDALDPAMHREEESAQPGPDVFDYLQSLPDVEDPFPPSPPAAEEQPEPEKTKAQLLADFIRERSRSALITPRELIAREEPEIEALLKELAEDETCKDILTVQGQKDVYYYSEDLMAHNYAKIAMLTLEKDDARTVAEMVRFNCKAFPTPTPVYYFARQPFFLSAQKMEAVLSQMRENPAYQDIRVCRAEVNGEKYLYSIDLMSEKYARALANGAESREADE